MYRLSETNYKYGSLGKLFTREQYLLIPYYDKALFDIIHPEDHFPYQVTCISRRGQETRYKFINVFELSNFFQDRLLPYHIYSKLRQQKTSLLSFQKGETEYQFQYNK